MAKRTGLSPDEIIGKCLWDFFTPQVAEYRKGWFDQVLTSKRPLRAEDNQTLGEGPLAYYDTWMYPILSDEGEITHIVINSRDISALKKTEQELQQSKRQLEVILEGVANGIYVLDQSGNLIYTNRTNTNQLINSFIDLNSTPETVFEKYNIFNVNEKAPCLKKLPGRSALRGNMLHL